MDLNALMGTLLSSESVKALSKNTGASEQQVQSVLGSALPLLLKGANAQAQDEKSGFAGALQQHAADDTRNIASFLSGVDKADGAKIIAHLLGAKTQSHTQSVAAQAGISTAQTGNILAVAAPLLMSLMGQQTAAAAGNAAGLGSLFGSLLGNADVGSLAMSLLGNGKKKPAKKDDGLDLGNVAGILNGLLK